MTVDRDLRVHALLRAQIIRHGDLIRHAPWWPEARRRSEAAIASILGVERVMVPRLRLSSVKPKQGGEKAAAGGRELHRAAPDKLSQHEADAAGIAPRETAEVFPLNRKKRSAL